MSRRKGSGGSRTRRLTPKKSQKAAAEDGFWEGSAELPDAVSSIRLAHDPAAVVRSLGPPPLAGRETIAEHYFEAVYGRAVGLASALAAAGDLPVETDE